MLRVNLPCRSMVSTILSRGATPMSGNRPCWSEGKIAKPLTKVTLEEIKARIDLAAPNARTQIVANDSAANQPSLVVDIEHALAVATFLRDDPELQFDYCSSVTGVDWLDSVAK